MSMCEGRSATGQKIKKKKIRYLISQMRAGGRQEVVVSHSCELEAGKDVSSANSYAWLVARGLGMNRIQSIPIINTSLSSAW